MQNKLFYSIIFISFLTHSFGQSTIIHGIITNEKTETPLPFVNLGIPSKGIGTVTNVNGEYTFTVPNSNDSILISLLGFYSKKISTEDFIKSPNIGLKEKVFQLREVVIKGSELKHKTIGNKTTSQAIAFNIGSGNAGSEVASIMKIKNRKTFLKNFKVNVVDNPYESVKFRLNLYNIKEDVIDTSIIQDNIVVEFTQKEGLYEIDLSKYNIVVHNDFAVALEWLDYRDDNLIMFSGSIVGSPTMVRDLKYTEWQKIPVFSIGYHMDVSYEK